METFLPEVYAWELRKVREKALEVLRKTGASVPLLERTFVPVRLPPGYWLYLDIRGLSLIEIAYFFCEGRKAGFDPVFIPEEGILLLGVFGREEDAREAAKDLEERGFEDLSVGFRSSPYILHDPSRSRYEYRIR